MKIALVILNWNGKALLEQFLPTMVAHSQQANIYVVDNASTDSSVAYVKDNFKEISIIEHPTNEGFAKGYNLAIPQIDADLIGLVNSDIEVTKNWLAPIISYYTENSTASIVQPKILDYNSKNKFEYAGAAGGYIDKYGYAFCRGRIFDSIEEDKNQYKSSPISWASGACLFIKNNDFKLLKGFDNDFFAHYEEIDLCWRAKNKGLEIHYIENSTVYHIGAATLKVTSPLKTYLNFRNSLFTLIKNLPKKQLIPVLFIRMVLDGLAGVQFLLKGQVKHLFSILKAHFSFYKGISRMYKKRDTHQETNYYYKKSIVWSYFIQQKHTL